VSRKFKVEITIPNAESRLKPGFFARIEVVTTFRNNVLVVPRSAIVVRDGEDVVFIAEDGKAKTRGIKVGIKGEDKVEITSGLKVGEQVIVEGNYALTDGTRVEVQQ
jgi:RND family efflux transporter MFP subunit